jgi:hypothetical protein
MTHPTWIHHIFSLYHIHTTSAIHPQTVALPSTHKAFACTLFPAACQIRQPTTRRNPRDQPLLVSSQPLATTQRHHTTSPTQYLQTIHEPLFLGTLRCLTTLMSRPPASAPSQKAPLLAQQLVRTCLVGRDHTHGCRRPNPSPTLLSSIFSWKQPLASQMTQTRGHPMVQTAFKDRYLRAGPPPTIPPHRCNSFPHQFPIAHTRQPAGRASSRL